MQFLSEHFAVFIGFAIGICLMALRSYIKDASAEKFTELISSTLANFKIELFAILAREYVRTGDCVFKEKILLEQLKTINSERLAGLELKVGILSERVQLLTVEMELLRKRLDGVVIP